MSNLFVVTLSAALLAACSTDHQVLLDGTPVRDLATAAELADRGSTIQLNPGVHTGGVVLPDGVVLEGVDATISGAVRLVDAEGDLTVRGVTFSGGTAEEGSALRVDGDLVLEGVTVQDALGEVAVRVYGELDVTGSTLHHDRTTVKVLVQTGRPPRLAISDTDASGLFDIPADFVELSGITGDARVVCFGHAFLATDSVFDSLELTGPSAHIAGVTVLDTARIDTQEAIILEASGGRWVLDVEELTGTTWLAEEISGEAEVANLSNVLATWIQLDGTGITAEDITAEALLLHMPAMAVRDVRAELLELDGTGVADSIIVDGAGPSVYLGVLDVAAMVVRSTSAPVRVRLDGTLIRGMAVQEPPVVAKAPSIDTNSFANIFNLTWHGGGAATFADGDRPLWVYDSILSRASASAHIQPQFVDSVVWHPDGVVGEVPGAIIDDPLFLAPDDPHLQVDSPYRDSGAFAGPTGSFVEALWNQL